jgi:hypothetical protein
MRSKRATGLRAFVELLEQIAKNLLTFGGGQAALQQAPDERERAHAHQ